MLSILHQECEKLGYKPRDVQIKAVEFLENTWEKGKKCKILSLPTGSGKSIIAKTIGEYNKSKNLITALVTPQNLLVEQYIDEFPELNFLKGKVNYKCHTIESNCLEGESYAKITKKPCEDCPYQTSKSRSYSEYITIFNPLSYISLKKLEDCETGRNIIFDVNTIIVDEFQSLAAMLRELSTIKIWENDMNWKKGVSNSIKSICDLCKPFTASIYISATFNK